VAIWSRDKAMPMGRIDEPLRQRYPATGVQSDIDTLRPFRRIEPARPPMVLSLKRFDMIG